jgi:hypothetical protein
VAVCRKGGWYAAVFNAGEKDVETEIALTDLEIYEPVSARELWSGETSADRECLSVKLPSHGAVAFLLKHNH